jgi:hypothetical protein
MFLKLGLLLSGLWLSFATNGQNTNVYLKEDNDIFFLDKIKFTGHSYITVQKLGSGRSSVKLVSLKQDVSNKKIIIEKLKDSLQTILDFYYDTTSARTAMLAEKETIPGTVDGNARSSKMFIQDIQNVDSIVSKCYYTYFDSAGYIGYKNQYNKSLYRRFDGSMIQVSDNSQQADFLVKTLGPVSSENISVVNTSKGYCMYNIATQQVISNFYPDSLWYFGPKIYIASRNKNFILIKLDLANAIVDSIQVFKSAKILEGKIPVIELVAANLSHTIITRTGRIIEPAVNSHRKIDSILNFGFEDKILVRSIIDSTAKPIIYETIDLRTGNIQHVTFEKPNVELFPFYKNFYIFWEDGKKSYIKAIGAKREWMINKGSYSIYKITDTSVARFFFCSRNMNLTTTSHIMVKNGNSISIDTLDQSIFTGERYAWFENNILRIKDDKKGGWKFIDGIALGYPKVTIHSATNFVDTSSYYYYKPASIKHVFHITPWPFKANNIDTALHLLVEVRQNRGQYRALRIEYVFPKSKTESSPAKPKRNHAR